MPLIYPNVPADEHSVPSRIVKKYLEYMKEYGKSAANQTSLQGERYEIAVAIEMHRRNFFTDGNQISRWHSSQTAPQHVSIGHNTEYDFVIPLSNRVRHLPNIVGPILGEAKSYSGGLAEYFKKAVGYCLNDSTLGGFCFVTPEHDYMLFMKIIHTAISILGGNEGAPAITGGDHRKNRPESAKPSGQHILNYYRNKYYIAPPYPPPTSHNYIQVLQNDYAGDRLRMQKTVLNTHTNTPQAALFRRIENIRGTAKYFNDEMAERAGFVIACFQVHTPTHDTLRDMMYNLPP